MIERERKEASNSSNRTGDNQSNKKHNGHLIINRVDEECNKDNNGPVNPSYSMMHSLREGVQVVMYSCTHRINLKKLQMHQSSAYQIVMGPP